MLRTVVSRVCLPRSNLKIARVTSRCYSDGPATGVPYKFYEADEESLKQEAPSQADVVVVGGGVSGCSVLYNLAKMGVTNAVMLEKDSLTAGTTWHTAGLVWRARPSDVESELITRGHHMMTSLEEETGVNTGWINNGGLFLARNKERLDEFKRFHTLAKVYGIETFVLTPDETNKLYPHCRVDDLYGSIHSPEDGTIDPAGYCEAMSRGATKRGAKVLQKCSVTGIDVQQDAFGTKRVQAVHTDRGTINTKCVVNCAGVWAPALGAMARVHTPLCAMKHAYIVTERIEGIQNMPNMRDHDASIYFKLQGDTLQIGGYEPFPIFLDKVQKDFAFSLYDLDWDVFGVHIEGAMHRLPVLETTGIRSTVCGPESFTADHKPLVGESPEVRGYFFNCGHNSAGMMMSGIGEQVAKWITHGRPELDMFSYDIRRFANSLTNNTTWINERSHESYAKNYEVVYPHDEPLASRNMLTDALHGELLKEGCHFQERHGYERPGWFDTKESNMVPLKYDFYGSYDNKVHENYTYFNKLKQDYTFGFPKHHDAIKEECRATRENVAIFDMSYFGKYYLIGPDAQKACDWLFTNDMRKGTGSTMYTCMCNKEGGTELDLTVSVLESGSGAPHDPKFEGRGFYLAVGGGAAQHGYSYVQDVIQDLQLNCHILDHSHNMCLISLQGPQSRALLQSLVNTDLSNEAFPFSTHKVVTVAGEPCRALRLSFVGELGWELHVPSTAAVKVYRALMDAGKQYGIANAGYRAIDSLSIEKGYRHWHGDLRSDDTPLESMLGFTCKLKSDVDFLGKDALLKQKTEGLKRKLVAITLDDYVCLLGSEVLRRDDVIVGYTRRADYAFTLNKSIAYGYVTRPDNQVITNEYLKAGRYTLEHLGNIYPAHIHLRTPFDPKHKRVHGDYS